MPASGIGQTPGTGNVASATATQAVLMSPFSGPTGSPFDNDVQMAPNGTKTSSGNASTGALSTGIGFGGGHVIGSPFGTRVGGNVTPENANGIPEFTDDYQPGISLPSNVSATLATLLAIGGGRSDAAVNGYAAPNPYAVQPLLGFGNGGSRDAGAGPAFTGFGEKSVTATGAVANGAAVEAGWVNRSGVSISTGQSVFGSSTTASPAVT